MRVDTQFQLNMCSHSCTYPVSSIISTYATCFFTIRRKVFDRCDFIHIDTNVHPHAHASILLPSFVVIPDERCCRFRCKIFQRRSMYREKQSILKGERARLFLECIASLYILFINCNLEYWKVHRVADAINLHRNLLSFLY